MASSNVPPPPPAPGGTPPESPIPGTGDSAPTTKRTAAAKKPAATKKPAAAQLAASKPAASAPAESKPAASPAPSAAAAPAAAVPPPPAPAAAQTAAPAAAAFVESTRPDPYATPPATPYGGTPATPYAGAPAGPSSTLSVLALVFGIIGLVLSLFFIGLLPAIAGVILGHLALKREPHARGMAVGGLVTGYVGVAISILWGLVIIVPLMLLWFAVGAAGTFGYF
ncbi:MAG: DUF4190 domain-containing protein [Microcella sp.]|uniref:DUF4190 domain-containing protein n=1 Tax=Microcella sp. TaxID=1913979 RepID=UPI0024C8420E|nr:DUF4190 domain-containing protein [Microcella sp.]UYN83340.1 MAG: DUF4190 domain-containing protein [Microcella sp.]